MACLATRRSIVPSRSPRAPLAAGWARRRARDLLDPLAVRRWRSTSAPVVPPRRLRARAGVPGIREYVEGGRQAAGELAQALTAAGRSPAEIESVLDFGCGSGRVLPHFARLSEAAQCTGCDVDPTAVAWAARNCPRLRWSVTGFRPPLPFGDESFELVYPISVLSHLDERLADLWLAEIRRVLRPDGVALLSVHGPHAFEQFRTGRVRTSWCSKGAFARAPLGAQEFVFAPYVRSVWNVGELPGTGDGYGLAFHGHEFIRVRWGQTLKVIDVLDRAMTAWQDIVVCGK